VVVVETIRRRAEVVDASPAASARGVRAGMSLAEGRALCPELLPLDRSADRDRTSLEALGRWMTRFTPFVATGWPPEKSLKANEQVTLPALLLLDLTGCERLFGSIGTIARGVRGALERFGLPSRVAVAPTPSAAWALAWAGKTSGHIVEEPELAQAIAPLPVEALRLGAEAVAALRHLGLRTIGQVRDLPRDALPSRFGPRLLQRIDAMLGARPDPLVPLGYAVPVRADVELEGPAESLEMLHFVIEELLRRVIADLARRGHGARQLELTCRADPAAKLPPVTRSVQLSQPTRNPKRMLELLRCATERLDCRAGFTRVQLTVPHHEHLTQEQILLLDADTHTHHQDLAFLLERLTLRLGPEQVLHPHPLDSHLPERAWQSKTFPPSSPHCLTAPLPHCPTASPPRPLHLPLPTEIRVVAEPCDDREGRPAQFTHQRRVHRLTHVLGPERIAGEWWRGHTKVRDYYDALDEDGRRFWIFRVVTPLTTDPDPPLSVRWFLHGTFQ
jgi:protein ImuB